MTRRVATVVSVVVCLVGAMVGSVAASATASPPSRHGGLRIEVLSGPARYVSGGAARLRVDVRRETPVQVKVNGTDVTSRFTPSGHALEGVLSDLPLGPSTVTATTRRERTALTLVNHPISGPMFSGPHQPDFFCSTPEHLAGFDLTGPFLDTDCSLPTRTDYYYRSTANAWRPYDPAAPRPADLATTPAGVDFVIRWERGTINRFIYSIAVLDPEAGGPAALPHWNRKLIHYFGGGVAIGHYQGSNNQSESRYVHGLGQGYAVAWSTGTKTNTHYNMVLGGETAMMVKSRFVVEYGEPTYTVGLGGSGGGIQQYLYGQNHKGLLDAAIPQYSYPDMVTQTIHVGDCELLERWMDLKVRADPNARWRQWSNRTLLEGLASSDTVANPYQPLSPWLATPGSTECVKGWRGLSPLVLNPRFGTAPGITPEQQARVEWTHWNDAVNVYGRDPETGYARSTWDNVGVQYGLRALVDGDLTPAEFLDLNADVGGWKQPQDAVQEGCPFIAALCPSDVDVWSARNINPSDANGVRPRTEGDVDAMRAAYRAGLVFDGQLDIPVIDWRHYLDAELDMHNARQSFVSRQRMIDGQGSAANQVIWFTDARPARAFDQTPMALAVMDQWLANIHDHPSRGVAGNKPAEAVDSCFATDGTLLYRGRDAWRGILDHGAAGPCTQRFPIHGTSRTVAGGPFDEQLYKCALQPVRTAIARGLYGSWRPTAAELARLRQIFPSGVCDYRRPDVGRP
ncbi:DUF6351 family protein [Actinophytocola sp.]|uniref:DUF6351 family protein n=1 Tax=Actinophytocola sp. TaxID=1872138 RepID=UPI002D50608C|nr:DUF6351 family protein [Actinophytocola sp.]HYQ66952.1 DUF6351 family protein [Actinophytocola sp.]